jgi:hypothetical protein
VAWLPKPRHLALNGSDTNRPRFDNAVPEWDRCQHPSQPGFDHPAGGIGHASPPRTCHPSARRIASRTSLIRRHGSAPEKAQQTSHGILHISVLLPQGSHRRPGRRAASIRRWPDFVVSCGVELLGRPLSERGEYVAVTGTRARQPRPKGRSLYLLLHDSLTSPDTRPAR